MIHEESEDETSKASISSVTVNALWMRGRNVPGRMRRSLFVNRSRGTSSEIDGYRTVPPNATPPSKAGKVTWGRACIVFLQQGGEDAFGKVPRSLSGTKLGNGSLR
jgi:hypothetical protein